jgi:hypothetical protein
MRIVFCTVLILISLCCLISLAATGDEGGATIDKPQIGRLIFANGQKTSGEVQSLNSNEVVLKYRGAIYTYKSSRLRSVETANGVYVYDAEKGVFEVSQPSQSKNVGTQGRATSPEQPFSNAAAIATKPTNSRSQNILAKGVGPTADDALKDAFRNAVRQVVGAMVDSETLVKNDELISDKVLTYSGGFIKTYDEVSKTQENGLFRITIKATVERSGVAEKLKAANVTLRHIDGKGKFAEVVTKLESEKDAKQLLERCLEGFPINLMEAEPVGEPRTQRQGESGVTLSFRVRLRANTKAYDEFAARLQEVLKRLAIRSRSFTLLPGEPLPVANQAQQQKRPGGRSGRTITAPENEESPKQVSVILNVGSSARGETSWIYYVLDSSVWEPLARCYSDRFLPSRLRP